MTDLSKNLLNACYNSDLNICQQMLDQGADIHVLTNSICRDGATALHIACINGNLQICKLLISRDVNNINIHVYDGEFCTPLYYACICGQYNDDRLEICQLLIDHGANIHTTQHGFNSIFPNAYCQNRLEVCKLLLDNGATTNNIRFCAPHNHPHNILEELIEYEQNVSCKPILK